MDSDQTEEQNGFNGSENATESDDQCTDALQAANETKTSQSNVSVRFENMLIDVVNATTLHLDWCPATDCDNIHGYKIRYCMKESPSYNEIFVTPGISNYTIGGLKPATEYIICVNAVDDKESIIHHCGTGLQRTDAYDSSMPGSTPYIAAIAAAVLLTVAIVVPLTILITAYDRRYDVPYIAAIAGITLLLVAAIVPISFLFVRKCGICSNISDTQLSDLAQDGVNGAFDRKVEFNDSSEILISDVKTNRSVENTNNYKTPKL